MSSLFLRRGALCFWFLSISRAWPHELATMRDALKWNHVCAFPEKVLAPPPRGLSSCVWGFCSITMRSTSITSQPRCLFPGRPQEGSSGALHRQGTLGQMKAGWLPKQPYLPSTQLNEPLRITSPLMQAPMIGGHTAHTHQYSGQLYDSEWRGHLGPGPLMPLHLCLHLPQQQSTSSVLPQVSFLETRRRWRRSALMTNADIASS